VKSVPRGKAIWNANGGFVSVLLTHLFTFLMMGLFDKHVHMHSLEIEEECHVTAYKSETVR